MTIIYSPNPRWNVCLPQITSDKTKHSEHDEGDDNNANTDDIDGRDDRQGAAPLSRARDDTAMRDPPNPWF
jgi:hypothetical protein